VEAEGPGRVARRSRQTALIADATISAVVTVTCRGKPSRQALSDLRAWYEQQSATAQTKVGSAAWRRALSGSPSRTGILRPDAEPLRASITRNGDPSIGAPAGEPGAPAASHAVPAVVARRRGGGLHLRRTGSHREVFADAHAAVIAARARAAARDVLRATAVRVRSAAIRRRGSTALVNAAACGHQRREQACNSKDAHVARGCMPHAEVPTPRERSSGAHALCQDGPGAIGLSGPRAP
jgi:hypothetical protein